MIDLEDTLSRLAAAPVHPGLAAMDDAVLTRLALRASQIPGSAIGLAAMFSLLVGIAGAGLPGGRGGAASAGPFGQPSALAPSTLLASNE